MGGGEGPREHSMLHGVGALAALANVAAAAATEHQREQLQSSSTVTTGTTKSDDEATLEGEDEASLNEEKPAPAGREISLGSKSVAATLNFPQTPYHPQNSVHLQPRIFQLHPPPPYPYPSFQPHLHHQQPPPSYYHSLWSLVLTRITHTPYLLTLVRTLKLRSPLLVAPADRSHLNILIPRTIPRLFLPQ